MWTDTHDNTRAGRNRIIPVQTKDDYKQNNAFHKKKKKKEKRKKEEKEKREKKKKKFHDLYSSRVAHKGS